MPTTYPINFADAGTTTPMGRPTPTRKETIMSLVEMLLQPSYSGHGRMNELPSFEDDRDVPTVDEHLQVEGAEAFNRFQRRVNNLDKELRNFANAARQLGSSVAILSSAFHLRGRLAQISYLYRQNAADLFPRKIAHLARESGPEHHAPVRRRGRALRRMKFKTPPHVARPTVNEYLDCENFPEQLEALAKDVTTFLNCLNEFPEFTDEAVNASILSFEGDLNYWASCLKEYTGQFRYPAVQRYIHDLSIEMGEHIDGITSSLSMFIEIGVPTIRFAQKHGATNLLNLSTVATFFSAVTATTLQFSVNLMGRQIDDVVNCFWFASLVFSIAAAVNSLLGLTWKQAMYRSPGHRVPWWVLIWIKRSPLVFLVMSVACFSVGLCCFTYASKQAAVTCTLTTVLTAFTSFGLVAVSAWFASERWIFLRHKGQKWLSDALIETRDQFLQLKWVEWIRKGFQFVKQHANKVRRFVQRAARTSASYFSKKTYRGHHKNDIESSSFPGLNGFHRPSFHRTPTPGSPPRTSPPTLTVSTVLDSPRTVNSPLPYTEQDSSVEANTPSIGKQLWRHALRTVQMHSLLSSSSLGVFGRNVEPFRRRTSSSNMSGGSERKNSDEPVSAVLRSRVAALVPKLMVLEPIQDLAAHQALVRHLQFSPDGKFLATSSWDRTSVIFKVGEPFVSHRILAHPQGFVGQVAWSPTGKLLLTKLPRGMKLWTSEDGVCTKTIDRHASVEAITWLPDGQTFLSVEGSRVTKLDLTGRIIDQYFFEHMKLLDVAVTPDGLRLLGIGPLLESPSGLQPSKSRAEKRLIIFNTETKQIENQVPVLHEVRDITVAQNSRSGLMALISYENKAPPQLWKIELVKDRETHAVSARLMLRHTYLPKSPVDFAGPSYFGGKDHELVLCAGKAGDILIWDQESGTLLNHIRAQANIGDLTCIAWNQASEDPFMFATGSHDGAVLIWSKLPPDADPDDAATPRGPAPPSHFHSTFHRANSQCSHDAHFERPGSRRGSHSQATRDFEPPGSRRGSLSGFHPYVKDRFAASASS